MMIMVTADVPLWIWRCPAPDLQKNELDLQVSAYELHVRLAFVEISQIHYTKSSGEQKEVVVGMSSTPGYVVA